MHGYLTALSHLGTHTHSLSLCVCVWVGVGVGVGVGVRVCVCGGKDIRRKGGEAGREREETSLGRHKSTGDEVTHLHDSVGVEDAEAGRGAGAVAEAEDRFWLTLGGDEGGARVLGLELGER